MNYYKRHLGDYAKNTRTLSTYEHGVYNLVLDLYYTDECAVSTDDAYAICRAENVKDRASVDRVLNKFFVLTDEGWSHGRAEKEIAKYREKSAKNKEIGSLGGKQKAKRNASETLEECLANDNPSHKPLANNQEEEKKEQARSPKNGSRLPDDFPTSDLITWARAERADVDPKTEVAKFRDYWLGKPGKDGRKADWPATWRNWIRNARATQRAGPGVATSKNGQAIETLERMKRGYENSDSGTAATPALPGPGRSTSG